MGTVRFYKRHNVNHGRCVWYACLYRRKRITALALRRRQPSSLEGRAADAYWNRLECRGPMPQRPHSAQRSIEHQVVRQWSFRARLTVLPPGWAPQGDGPADGGVAPEGLASGSPAARAAAAAGAAAVLSAQSPAGAADGGASSDVQHTCCSGILSCQCTWRSLLSSVWSCTVIADWTQGKPVHLIPACPVSVPTATAP